MTAAKGLKGFYLDNNPKRSVLSVSEQSAFSFAAISFRENGNLERYLAKVEVLVRNKVLEVADKEHALHLN